MALGKIKATLMSTTGSPSGSVAGADIEALRLTRKLAIIQGANEGEAIEFVKPGTYGFTYSPVTDGVPLFSRQSFQIFEVHKLLDGAVHYIGYLTPEEALALDKATDAIDVTLYPEAHEKSTQMVSVPKDRVLKSRTASRDQGNFIPLTLSPKR